MCHASVDFTSHPHEESVHSTVGRLDEEPAAGGAVAFRTLVPYPMDTLGVITIRAAVFDRSTQIGLLPTRIGTAHAWPG